MISIEYSPAAIKDLKAIQKKVETNWGKEVATNVLKKITSQIRKLEQFPLLGVNLGEIIDVPSDYRYVFNEKNYIFYYVESKQVRIVRILNERQDYLLHMFGYGSKVEEDKQDDVD